MPTLERFKRNGAVFAETLGDSYPDLESKGFTVNGDPQVVDTPYGRGMSFDGNGDYLTQTNQQLDFTTSSSFSGSVWVKLKADKNGYVYTKRDGSTGWGLYYYATGRYFTIVDDAGIEVIAGFVSPEIDTWNHVAFTYDGTTLRMYLNGVAAGTGTSVAITANTHDFIIGDRTGGSSVTQINADIVNPIIFPLALSAQEVSDLYNQTTFNYMDNLVSRWDMSEINPQDLTGTNDGTGTSIVASDIVVGQHGDAKAIDFDGSNDYVTVSNSSSITPGTNNFTVGVWVKSDQIGVTKRLFSKTNGGTAGSNNGYWIALASSGLKWQFVTTQSGASSVATSSNHAEVNRWYFVVGTYDGSNARLYVNGVLDTTGTTGAVNIDGTSNLIIGGLISADWDGKISNGFYINGLLTELQVRDLYEQTRQSSKSTSRINNPAYLKAYLPLNSHTDDVSGNGNDGTPTSLTYVDGQFGRTVSSFSGSSYITIPYSSEMNPSNGIFTYTAWIYLDSVSGLKTIFDSYNGASNSGVLAEIVNDGLTIQTNSSGAAYSQTLFTSDANKWVHVAFVFDGSNIYVYKDGIIQTGSPSSYTYSANSSIDLKIGTRVTPAEYFVGDMSNFRFLNVALTGEEIQQIYRMEQTVPKAFPAQQPYSALPDITDSSLVASHLNKATFGTGKDYSLNNNDMTNTAVVLGNDQGVFDNSSSSVLSGSATGITGSNPVTVCATIMITGSSSDAGIIGTGITNGFQLALHNGSTIYWYIQNGGNGLSVSGYSANTWHRVVATWDGTTNANGMKLYVDGELVGTKTSTNASISSNNVLQIGRATSSFTGTIKYTEVYSEAKDASWVSQDYAKRVPDNNLQLWLKDSLDDKSRYNRTGTTVNIIEGNKLEFNGTDSVFSTGSDWISTNDITLMGWINPDSFGEANEGRIFDNGKTIFFINSTLNRLRFTSDGGSTQSRADNAISTGQWQHVAVTRNGTMSTLYVNGVDVTDVGDSGTPASGSTVVFIGNNQAGSRTFDGKMDDVRGYNRILTASEIKSHYLQTRGQY